MEEVTRRANLTTWTVADDDLLGLELELTGKPGVDIVTPFADSLRISGHDAELLEETISPYISKAPQAWQRTSPTLEDVFIRLMNQDSHRRT